MSIKRTLKRSFSICVIALLILSSLSILKPALAQVQPASTVLKQIYVPVVFTNGTTYPTIGLAFDGTNLYYSAGFESIHYPPDTRIIETDTNGNLLKVIQTNPPVALGGLGWDGTLLWGGIMFSPGETLYTVDPATGQTTPKCTIRGVSGIDGLTYDQSSNTIFLGSNFGNTVWQVSTSCNVLGSFPTNFPTSGVEFDGRYAWVVDPTTHTFHQFSTNGTEISVLTAVDLFHEDLAFDPATFAPKCALWSMEAYAPTVDPRTGMPANRITATEIPCPYGSARKVSIIAGPGGSVSYRFAGGSGIIQGGSLQAIQSVLDNPISLAATPSSGSVFSIWSATTGVDTTFNDQPLDLTSPNITPVITGNGLIIAKFSSEPASTNLLVNVNSSVITEGSSSKITATVLDQYGMPISGVSVDFASTMGMLSSSLASTDALGHASVTLAPNVPIGTAVAAVVSGTANGLTAVKTVTFVPQTPAECNVSQSWRSCGAFEIATRSMTIPEAVKQLPVIGGVGNALLNLALDDYPISIYSLGPTCSTDACKTSFTNNLQNILGISVPQGYLATEVIILEVPLISILDNAMCYHVNVIFDGTIDIGCLNIPATNNGASWAWGFQTTTAGVTPYIQLTGTGSLGLALTFSTNPKAGSELNLVKLAFQISQLMIDLAIKHGENSQQTVAQALNLAATVLKGLADSGDATLSIITSDLSTVGVLSSYSVFDFDDFADSVATALNTAAVVIGTGSKNSMVKVATDIVTAGFQFETGDIPAALIQLGRCVLDTVNLATQYVVSQPPLSDNWWAQGIAGAFGVVVSIIDPMGSTVVPSYYDSGGRLILGYNATSGTAIFTSSSGILFATNDTYYAYVFGGGNVTVRLNTIGPTGVLVPYELEAYNMSIASTRTTYAGLLEVGSRVDVDLDHAKDGSIIPQLSVVPNVEVVGNRVLAIPLLTNGTKVAARSAFVFIGSQAYQMSQVNATLFSLDLNPALGGSILLVYVVVSGFVGGYATSYFPAQVNPASQNRLPWWQQYWYLIVAGLAASVMTFVSIWTVRRRKPRLGLSC